MAKIYFGRMTPANCKKCLKEFRKLNAKNKDKDRVIIPGFMCARCPYTIEDFTRRKRKKCLSISLG